MRKVLEGYSDPIVCMLSKSNQENKHWNITGNTWSVFFSEMSRYLKACEAEETFAFRMMLM